MGSLLRGSFSADTLNFALGLAFICSLYPLLLGIYRITVHPLARFPGPKFAALTYWYEFYYDIPKKGSYLFKIEEFHRRYGPVVRVNPNEIHIADSDFYPEIYHSKSYKTNRDSWYNYVGEGVAFTTDHDVHARRRKSLAGYFSTGSVRALEGRITAVLSIMNSRLCDAIDTQTVIDLANVFTALTVDIISEYSFGKSNAMNLMSHPDFAKMWLDMSKVSQPLNALIRHFKIILKTLLILPTWTVVKLAPSMADSVAWQQSLLDRVKSALVENEQASTNPTAKNNREATIFNELITSPDLTAEDKMAERLREEAVLVVGAGTETTATTLTRTAFYIISDAVILRKLSAELEEAIVNPRTIPSIDSVSNLPYLNAVIEEGLRMSLPVIGRFPRVFQSHALRYGDWVIPPGYAVSQSNYFVSSDPKIFPDPATFNPDRWLNNSSLQRYQTAFSKGRFACLGINLAYAELRLCLATFFRRFDVELYETTLRDVQVVHDFIVGQPSLDSKGVRVKIIRERE